MGNNSSMYKFKSRKFWITLWSIAIITFIVVADRTEFASFATFLSAVPLAYIGLNVYDKTHSKKDM